MSGLFHTDVKVKHIFCEQCGSYDEVYDLILPNFAHILLCKNCMDKLTDFLKLSFGTKEEEQ